MVEVGHGLHLQTSHLVTALHLALRCFLSSVASPTVCGTRERCKPGTDAGSLGLPGRDANSEAQVGLRAWGFHQSPRRVCRWTPDHPWENPDWSYLLLVGTDHPQGLLRFGGFCFVLTGLGG